MPTPKKHASPAARQAAYRRRNAAPPEPGASRPPGRPVCPGPARWRSLLADAVRLTERVEQEMEAVYAQRTERWQASERGETYLEQLEALREILVSLEEWSSSVPG